MESYKVEKEGINRYVFTTKNDTEYQLALKPSGMVYQNLKGETKNVLELALNCDINTAEKDYKTLRTLVSFYAEMSYRYDAIIMQIHNQPEIINNGKVQRRGLSRIKLWTRVLSKHFSDHILLTNLVLNPNKKSDIFSIIIKKDSIYFKQFVMNFYRFCYSKMYKIES